MSTDSVLTLKLPEGYTFADLKIRRCDDEAIDLDMDLVKLICQVNGLNFDKVLQNPGPVVTSILTVWYKSHLAQGGAPDALMEELKSQGPRLNLIPSLRRCSFNGSDAVSKLPSSVWAPVSLYLQRRTPLVSPYAMRW